MNDETMLSEIMKAFSSPSPQSTKSPVRLTFVGVMSTKLKGAENEHYLQTLRDILKTF